MSRRIAKARIYGHDHKGREVLIAAPGQAVPDDLEVDSDLVQTTGRSGAEENTRQDGPKRRKRTTRASAAAQAKAAEAADEAAADAELGSSEENDGITAQTDVFTGAAALAEARNNDDEEAGSR